MLVRPDVSLEVRRTATGAVLVDLSCGRCATCLAGASSWCTRPEDEGRVLTEPFAADRAGVLVDALGAAAALVEAPPASTVLVVDVEDGPLSRLVPALVAGRVVVAPDPFDAAAKAALVEVEASGRAPVVVAGPDARAAVKAVRRGGHVCLGFAAAQLPSVTQLVQREVTLLGPRDAAGTLRRLGRPTWTAAVAAAA